MSFQQYLKKNLGQKKRILPEIEFEVSPYEEFPFLKKLSNSFKYLFNTNKTFVNRYLEKRVNVLSKYYTKKKVYKISHNSILVEISEFEAALKVAISYFKVLNRRDLLWKKIYYSEPNKNKKIDAYKFININSEKDIINYVMEGDRGATAVYLPVEIEVTRNGKFLMYHSEIANKELMPGFVRHLLMKLDVEPTPSLVNKICRNPKKWFKVGEWYPNQMLDAYGKLVMENDNINAYLHVCHPSKEGKILDERDIKKIISNHGIVYGIDWDRINDYLKKKRYGEPLLLASGIPTQNGADAYFKEYYLELIKENGEIEKRVNVYVIQKGDILLKKVQKQKGKAGTDVFGNLITALDGKDRSLEAIAGLNTSVHDNGTVLKAEINGHVYFQNGKWTVQEVLELDEVGYKTGNIKHRGTVVVHGSIFDGYSVLAAASIFVKESVGACVLEAEGDIEIKLGMSGKKSGKVTSRQGMIHAKFFQDCTISAKKNVCADKLLSGCKVESEDSILVSDAKGSIWGGKLYAYKEIKAEHIGAISGRKVFLSVGIEPELRRDISKTKREREDKIYEMKELKDIIVNEPNLEIKNEKNEELERIEEQLISIDKKLNKLMNATKESTVEAKVVAMVNLFSGVTIQINNVVYENRVFRKSLEVIRNPKNPDEIIMNKFKKKRK